MMLGVGGAVHIVFGPLEELLGVDGVAAVSAYFLAVEVMAGRQLKQPVCLLAHQ